MEEIKLYIINLDIGFSHKHHLLKVINESQKEKALKYKNDKDQMRSLLSSYLKNLISKEEILYKEKDIGKLKSETAKKAILEIDDSIDSSKILYANPWGI